MRWKTSAGVLVALAFLIPAAPAVAGTEPPVLDNACHTIERNDFKDIRELLTIDLDGNRVAGEGPIHLEAVLHTAVYRARPDVSAVAHTHPLFATAFGAVDAKLEMINHDAVLFHEGLSYFDDTAELIVTTEQGDSVAAALGDKRVVVMRGHGVVITGKTLPWVVYTALTLERVLEIQAIARSLGELKPMSDEMAGNVYRDKYRDEFIGNYWNYLIRQVERSEFGPNGSDSHARAN